MPLRRSYSFFFFNDTATTEIYTLSLHDALPICRFRPMHYIEGNRRVRGRSERSLPHRHVTRVRAGIAPELNPRSEEHTSELQSPCNLVCRLLLEKKNIEGFNQCPITKRAPIRRF